MRRLTIRVSCAALVAWGATGEISAAWLLVTLMLLAVFSALEWLLDARWRRRQRASW